MLTSHSGYSCTIVSLEIFFLIDSFNLAPLYLRKTEVCLVPSTNGPSGHTGRPLAASNVQCWRRGFRRARRRVAGLLGFRIRVRVRIRARNLVLSEMAAADRRAIVASAAGPVGAARSAAAPLPRSFSWQAQGLARRIPALLSCFQHSKPSFSKLTTCAM